MKSKSIQISFSLSLSYIKRERILIAKEEDIDSKREGLIANERILTAKEKMFIATLYINY